MRQLRWLTLLWPGWPQLWFAGAWSGLAIALGFAVLLDVGLLTCRMWTELLGPGMRLGIWLVLAAIWTVSAAVSWRWVGGLRTGRVGVANDELFVHARGEYLKGNWFEAETALGRLLDQNVLDIEARLMRATLLVRTARRKEATAELGRLTRMEGGERWTMEIARLQSRLAEAASDETADHETTAEPAVGTQQDDASQIAAADAEPPETPLAAATQSKAA